MKKRLISGALYLTLLSVFMPVAMADGLAGPNQKACPIPNGQGFVEPVRLGVDNPPAGLCYYWEPNFFLDDRFSANPMANPPSTTTYTLYAVTENFGSEKVYSVTVEVIPFNSYQVIPKCCYQAGKTLTKNDFEIITDPPGFEHMIDFEPKTIGSAIQLSSHYDQTIAFTTPCSNQAQSVIIQVVNPDVITGGGFSIPSLDKFNWAEASAKIDKAIEKFFSLTQSAPFPCEVKPETTFEGGFKTFEECCESGCITEAQKIEFYQKICGKLTCDIPIAGIPLALSVNVRLLMGLCMSPGVSFELRCQDELKLCLSIPVEATAGGGISLTAFGGSILDASGTLVSKITPPTAKLCFKPEPKLTFDSKLCAQVDANLEVKLFSLVKTKYSFTVVPKDCINLAL
ncbi:MAG: hypothetical protein AB9842_02180 [Bacteroidales bacterium]